MQREIKEILVLKVPKVTLDQKVIQVELALKVLRVLRVQQVLKELQELQALRVLRVLRDLKVKFNM